MTGRDLVSRALMATAFWVVLPAFFGTFWPIALWLAAFVLLVATELPPPVEHDPNLPARVLSYFDEPEDRAASVSAAMGLPYVGRERRRWRAQR
jgi:hypothetical protein